MTTAELLKSIRSLVAYHKSCGVQHYRRSDALDAGLRLLETVGAEEQSRATKAVDSPSVDMTPAAPACGAGTVTIDELAAEIETCRLCELWQTRNVSTPGNGGPHPDLLVVGEWLKYHPEETSEALFGEQQDLMLSRMIAAIRLRSSEVFITNLIKCSVAQSGRPDANQIATCLGYLKQQIGLLAPRVIVTMGTTTSQALLDSSRPLIALRGRFHQFQVGDGAQIPLMPTFHPTYLLKNPEMKQPTWNDLQAVKKKLDEAPGTH